MDSFRSDSPITPMAKPHDHQSLLQALRGQTVRIPDLEASISHWPRAVSPHLDSIRHETKEIIDKYISTSFHFPDAIGCDGLTGNEQAFHGQAARQDEQLRYRALDCPVVPVRAVGGAPHRESLFAMGMSPHPLNQNNSYLFAAD
jgi:hypothetical protein